MKVTYILPSVGRKQHQKYIKSWQMEPLSIAQVAGLTPENVKIEFFDDRIENINYDSQTDLVAISVETYTAKRAYQIASKYREKGIKVVLGGFHPTLMPEDALRFSDSIVIGEAENVWKTVIEDAEKGKLKRTYQDCGCPTLENRMPNRDIFQGKKYLPISLVESGRGCCFSCNFCSVTSFYKAEYRARPAHEIVTEIKSLKNRFIFLVDDNLGANAERAKELFRALIPLRINWVSQISVTSLVDQELLGLMAESGCTCVLIGFESLRKNNLTQMNKGWNNKTADYEEILECLKKKGIGAYGTFMFGYDEDSERTFEETLRFALDNKLFLAAFNHLVPFPGTPLYERLKKEGRLKYKEWWLDADYHFGDVAFHPKAVSSTQLRRYCIEYRKKFYSIESIISRLPRFRLHIKWAVDFYRHISLNLLLRKEVMQRAGLPIGEK